MKTFLETVGPCRVRVRVAFDPPEVSEVRREVVDEMSKVVRVPGFRPGHVPRDVTELRFRSEIAERTGHALLDRATVSALEAVPDRALMVVDRGAEAVGAPGEPHECWVVVETMPAFELPDYRGIPVRVSSTTVTDEEVDRALEALREERMSYREVTDRPVSAKDWVKVDAEGQLEGRPLAEMEGAARRLARITGQWLSTDPGAFPPGLGAGLVGAKVGETRAVTVTFPEQFGVAELAGRNLEYRATVLAIREPVLPDVDESFCTAFGVRTLDELRAKLREELAAARRARVRDEIRSQVIEHLLSRTTMTLPAGAVEEETRDVVADIVRHAMARGASEEELRRNRERIEMTARTRAEQRLRLRFILERIADAEGITVTDDDLERHARVFAASAGTDPATWLRQMRERGRLDQLRAMLRPEKALDHVQSLARVEEGGTQ